jgi:uncharacterized protein (TIGR03437 family)
MFSVLRGFFLLAILGILAGSLSAQLLHRLVVPDDPTPIRAATRALMRTDTRALGEDRVQVLRSGGLAFADHARASLRRPRGRIAPAPEGSQPRAAAAMAETWELQLFADTVFQFVGERSRQTGSAEDFVLSGALVRGGEGRAVLSHYQGAVSGSIRLRDGRYFDFTLTPDGRGEARELQHQGLTPGANDTLAAPGTGLALGGFPQTPASAFATAGPLPAGEERPATVGTIHIAYSQLTLDARGGIDGLFSYVYRVEEEANEILRNSGIRHEWRVVSLAKVPIFSDGKYFEYAPGFSLSRFLEKLSPDAYYFESNRKPKADFHSYWANSPVPASGSFLIGAAYQRSPFDPNPTTLSVVHQEFAGGPSFTLTHEMGHNLGCAHDEATDTTIRPLSFRARGYQQRRSTPLFHTVMAYGCNGCLSIPHFSNPAVNYEGIPTGTDRAACSETIDQNLSKSAAWGGAPPPDGCALQVYPRSVSLAAEQRYVSFRIITGDGCLWSASADRPENLMELSPGSEPAMGPGWLRAVVQSNLTGTLRSTELDVRGIKVTITHLSSAYRQRYFPAATLQSGVNEPARFFCVGQKGPVASYEETLTRDNLATSEWLSLIQNEFTMPEEVCALADPRGMSAGLEQGVASLEGIDGLEIHYQFPVTIEVREDLLPLRPVPQALSFRYQYGSRDKPGAQEIANPGPLPSGIEVYSSNAAWLRVDSRMEQGNLILSAIATTDGLMGGIYDARIEVRCTQGGCASRFLPVRLHVIGNSDPGMIGPGGFAGPTQHIASGGVVSAAGFIQGLSSGSWASIFGKDLAHTTRGWRQEDFLEGVRLPTMLDDTRIRVDGKLAAISFVSPGQVNFQCPDLGRSGWVLLELESPVRIDSAWVWAQSENPAFFAFSGGQHVAALHADGVPVGAAGDYGEDASSRPARPGDVVQVFGSGFGETTPSVRTGWILTEATPLTAAAELEVTIGGEPAEIEYAGLTGAGLNQVNLRVPDLPAGRHPVRVRMRGIPGPLWGEILVGAP